MFQGCSPRFGHFLQVFSEGKDFGPSIAKCFPCSSRSHLSLAELLMKSWAPPNIISTGMSLAYRKPDKLLLCQTRWSCFYTYYRRAKLQAQANSDTLPSMGSRLQIRLSGRNFPQIDLQFPCRKSRHGLQATNRLLLPDLPHQQHMWLYF